VESGHKPSILRRGIDYLGPLKMFDAVAFAKLTTLRREEPLSRRFPRLQTFTQEWLATRILEMRSVLPNG
jgi:hypothetical protein